MPESKKTRITEAEFFRIMTELDKGRRNMEIAKLVGRPTQTIDTIKWARKRHLSGEPTMYYQAFFKHWDEQTATKHVSEPAGEPVAQQRTPAPAQPDHFDQLKAAVDQYNSAIETFLVAEVKKRSEAVIAENKQLKEKVAKLNQEIIKYQEAFADAKNSNWVDKLRKQWSNQ